MADVTMSSWRAAPGPATARWMGRILLLVAVLGAGGLALVQRPASGPTRLRPALIGLGQTVPDVRIEPAPRPKAAPPPRPAEPAVPIRVPDDPYAKEPILEVGRIEIPKLGMQQRLMHGITLRNIDLGPSHWPGTPWPGEAGNVVVAGHRVTHSKPFRNIDRLVPGDLIVVTARGVRATYKMATTFLVTPDKVSIVNPTPTPMLTIFACHPPGSARQRIVVRADLVSTAPA